MLEPALASDGFRAMAKTPSKRKAPSDRRVGKRMQFDAATWQAIDLLASDSMKDFQELADEAFRDLLKKHHRPVGLSAALKQSLGRQNAAHDRPMARRSRGSRRKP